MEWLRFVVSFIPPIHREGHIFIYIFAGVSLVLGAIWTPLGWLGIVLTLWCVYFFRNPERVTPVGDQWVVSPGDGRISQITEASPPPELALGEEERTRISIFLSVFDVHVNRVPATGTITDLHYNPGKFLSANLDKASDENERQTCLLKTKDGKEVIFVQIAGMVARRIVCTLTDQQKVQAGERFGIIRFGSRVDIYLPEGATPQVVEGQYALGGETILADLSGKLPAAKGEVR